MRMLVHFSAVVRILPLGWGLVAVEVVGLAPQLLQDLEQQGLVMVVVVVDSALRLPRELVLQNLVPVVLASVLVAVVVASAEVVALVETQPQQLSLLMAHPLHPPRLLPTTWRHHYHPPSLVGASPEKISGEKMVSI